MAGESRTTTDHAEIRRWAEERQGHPATVKGTGGKTSRFSKFVRRQD